MRFALLTSLCLLAHLAVAQTSPQILHRFGPGPVRPTQPLALGGDGCLYGFSGGGAADPASRVFRVTPQGQVEGVAQLEYTNSNTGGFSPFTLDRNGVLWASAVQGCQVCSVNASGQFSETGGLASIVGGGRLLLGADGNVYGIASNETSGRPEAVQWSASAATPKMTVLPTLNLTSPQLLLATQAETMVGVATAPDGGTNFFTLGTDGKATIFAHGAALLGTPLCLVEGTDGTLYGFSANGGAGGLGAIFRLVSGQDAEMLFEFDSTDAGSPSGGLAFGDDRKLYGFTGGTAQTPGIAFRVATDGTFENLGPLPGVAGAGAVGLARMGSSFYGLQPTGGDYQLGAVVQLGQDGTSGLFTTFQPYGKGPQGPLIRDAQGNLYGVTYSSGPDLANGLVYKLAPGGKFTVIALFPNNVGSECTSGIVFGPDGALYGVFSSGARFESSGYFRVGLDGSFTLLGTFDNDAVGGSLQNPLHLAADGNFYTYSTGNSTGAVLRLSPDGTVKSLATLAVYYGDSPISYGYAGLGTFIDGPDGALYGVTVDGGAHNGGAILRVDLQGNVAIAASLPGGLPEMGQPVIGGDGALYVLNSYGEGGCRWPFSGDPESFFTGTDYSDVIRSNGLAKGPDGGVYGLSEQYSTDDTTLALFRLSVPGGQYHSVAPVADPLSSGGFLLENNVPLILADGTVYGLGENGYGFIFQTTLPPNSPPVVPDSSFGVVPGAQTLDVLAQATDADNDALTITAVQGETQGTVTINADQTLTYTPSASFNGTDSFTITVTDGYTLPVTATVTVIDQAPSAPDLSVFVKPHPGKVIIDLLKGATDPDPGQTLSIAAVGTPTYGTVTLAGGSATYAPGKTFPGSDSFTYTVSDGLGGQVTATVFVRNVGLALAPATYYAHMEPPAPELPAATKVTFARGGAFTGTVSVAGATVPVAGKLGPDGTWEGTFRVFGIKYLFDLTIDPTTHALQVYLQAGDDFNYHGGGGPNVFAARNPAPAAGRYTFIVYGGTPVAGSGVKYILGDGYGVMTVSASGAVRCSGHLRDGGVFSAAGQVVDDGTCVLQARPSYGYVTGLLGGEITFANEAQSDAMGTVTWAHLVLPTYGQFEVNAATFVASRYTPVKPIFAAPDGALLKYRGGPITTQVQAPLSLATNGLRLVGSAGTPANFAVTEANGLFSGSFKDPTTLKTYTTGGVFLPKLGVGVGAFRCPGGYGIVEFLAAP